MQKCENTDFYEIIIRYFQYYFVDWLLAWGDRAMRIEILISNLLFGMTILTGALALAHLVGDFLIRGRNINPRLRKSLRVLIASFSVAVCLSIFLRFSNTGSQRNFFSLLSTDSPTFLPSPRLVVSDPFVSSTSSPANEAFIDEERLKVLTERIPDNILALTNHETVAKIYAEFPKMTALFKPDDKLAEDCGRWHSLLSNYGLLQSEKVTSSESSVLLACSSAPSDHPQWQQIEKAQKNSLLLVGSAGDAPNKLFTVMFPDVTFATSSFQQDAAVAFTGADLLSMPFPPGLRLFLGKDWLEQPGTVMSGMGSITIVNSHWQKFSESSSVLSKSAKGERRVLWTSLPAQLYGKLQFAYEPYWTMLHLHMTCWLNRVPLSSMSPLPIPIGQTIIQARMVNGRSVPALNSNETLIVDSHSILTAETPIAFPDLVVRYEPSLEQSSESPTVIFKKLVDHLTKDRKDQAKILLTSAIDGSLQYAIEQKFTGILQSVITDRPVPFIPATRGVSESPEEAVPTATALLMTMPEFESDASIGLRSHGPAVVGVPNLQFVSASSLEKSAGSSESSNSSKSVLSLSQYFTYWQQKSRVAVGMTRGSIGSGKSIRGQFVITNTNSEALKAVAMIYSEAQSIRVVENKDIKIHPQELAADVGIFVISEIQPQAVVTVFWEAKP